MDNPGISKKRELVLEYNCPLYTGCIFLTLFTLKSSNGKKKKDNHMKSSGGVPGPDRGSGREQKALRSCRGLLYTLQLLGEILYFSSYVKVAEDS